MYISPNNDNLITVVLESHMVKSADRLITDLNLNSSEKLVNDATIDRLNMVYVMIYGNKFMIIQPVNYR